MNVGKNFYMQPDEKNVMKQKSYNWREAITRNLDMLVSPQKTLDDLEQWRGHLKTKKVPFLVLKDLSIWKEPKTIESNGIIIEVI